MLNSGIHLLSLVTATDDQSTLIFQDAAFLRFAGVFREKDGFKSLDSTALSLLYKTLRITTTLLGKAGSVVFVGLPVIHMEYTDRLNLMAIRDFDIRNPFNNDISISSGYQQL